MYTYTYTYAEKHREDFKSRVVLVRQNLTNSQANHKAEKHTSLLFVCAVPCAKTQELCSTDVKVKAVI